MNDAHRAPKLNKRRHENSRRRFSSGEKHPQKKHRRNRALQAIYRNPDGSIPNLTRLERTHSRRWVYLTAIFIILSAGLAGAWQNNLLPRFWSPSSAEAAVKLSAPMEASILTPFSISISLQAGQEAVSEATLSLFLPNGFELQETNPLFTAQPSERERQWGLSAQDFKGSARVTAQGFFWGNLDEQKTFRAVLTYRPANFTSEFQTNTSVTVKLSDTPLTFTIQAPERIRGGEEFALTATLANEGSLPLTNLTIKKPENNSFALLEADTPLTIAELNPLSSVSLETKGSFEAHTEGVSNLIWQVETVHENKTYILAHARHTMAVTRQPLLLFVDVNDAQGIPPGGILRGTVRYQNNSAAAVENPLVMLTLEGPSQKRSSIFDWTRLETTGSPSVADATENQGRRATTITWNASSIPTLQNLKPGEQGVLSFAVPLKTHGVFDLSKLGREHLSVHAQAVYQKETVTAQPAVIALIADTQLNAGAQLLADTVVLQWGVEHHYHELSDVRVIANLFGSFEWTGQTDTSVGTLTYHPQQRLMVWTVPSLNTKEGTATATAILRLSGAPDPTQTALMGETTLTATDIDINLPITRTAAPVGMPSSQ